MGKFKRDCNRSVTTERSIRFAGTHEDRHRNGKRREMTVKVDQIFRNANIFTSDINHPSAAAFAVKEGKFIYVGDEAGLSAYEGEVTDLGGRFVMPGIIDSHALQCGRAR